ncbi:MAG TPA: methylenetetrahydrofolate--tRNA-(uracil(54)-C(5))-methyltransferase (FADH(2)-oxidizing) TrmFO [Candidatus Faeciplasma gallinarum]|uniref:Methylenetetrahydrofolate--tRNA-(uracil-5-)-methyltransferase TrmFO n=1 Tax=Candidatus Faeciplasma gallinarum TaxID=2840799 RepID=A0A9D1JHE1_9FIRM|nr:methylenetetrahydrofolate--tRNA-(uracil(54)-C(5))-methyltransferase (FADH(2)-oxidizing) TrmFO [Candidatus Faeciplasma gallinarum]
MTVKVVGAGLAGCEAAWQLANAGIDVELYEMKPLKYTPAHKYSGYAELVCSNSLKAQRLESAAGLLKEEMRRLGSLCMDAAQHTCVPAGGALAVCREEFSDFITDKINSSPKIKVVHEEVTTIPDGYVIIATGPLTSEPLSKSIGELVGENYLYFHDAAAPIVTAESLDKSLVFEASRYDRGDADYLNCPMNKDEYLEFYNELVNAETAPLHDFEQKEGFTVYEGCMPIEVLAKRGEDTMRFGPLKPVGLVDPRTSRRPYAVVQLRKENNAGTLYNLVGFQTNLKFGEQKRVFSLIPGLENAEFVRYGVMHRNTYLNSPELLNRHFCFKGDQRIYFAGQMSGVEGYMESAASGIYAGLSLARRLNGLDEITLPEDTMIGALSAYVEKGSPSGFQPMGANMGILPELPEKIKNKQEKYAALAKRALSSLEQALHGGSCDK